MAPRWRAWQRISSGQDDITPIEVARGRIGVGANQLRLQRERLERLRPLFAQASSLLLHGIIVQSRTVPSMVVLVGDEQVPLDAEEDSGPEGVKEI